MLGWLRRTTLRQRIGAIIVLHALLMSGTLIVLVRIGPGIRDRVYLMPDPDRVAAIATAFERAPPDTYPDLLRAFHDDRQDVTMLPALPPLSSAEDRAQDGAGDAAKAHYRKALGGRPFRIETRGREISADLNAQPLFSHSPFRVIVALPNGRAVAVQKAALAPVGKFLSRLTIIGVAVLILDILVIFWLAALTTVPVERLADAVRRDDPDVAVPSGPREMTELAETFRQMRARLHALIEERTRIIAAVAHDFRTYLTRLELRGDFIADAEQRALAERDLHEMRMLIDDALTFARPGPEWGGEEAEVDLCEELAEVVRTRHELGETVTLAGDCAGWRARVTPLALRRMLANLLDNAGRYGGGAARIAVARQGGVIAIGVEDDGPGVPESLLPDLTEPFMRLESSRARHTGGVGLGLSIVQALAHRFGGTLRLENRHEGGLRAVLTLHAADAVT